MRATTPRVALFALLMAVALAMTAGSALAAPTLTEIPQITSAHDHPYDSVPTDNSVPGAPTIDLAANGYVEREFEMSGGATTYRQSGFWLSNGRWGVSTSQNNVPYKTRLLIRYPTNPAKFNGTVLFEWLNDTTGGDQDPLWSQVYQQALRDGYAYVGVTAQAAGMKDLATWAPDRYGDLGTSGDAQSYDIFTQAAQAVRSQYATLLGGLKPKKLIGGGDSQSAFRLVTYVNAIQPVTHAFDGFLAVGRSSAPAPLGNGLIATSPVPALIRTDNTAPFIQLNTQGDVLELGAGLSRQSDNNSLRTWELPGAAHIDAHEGAYEVATIARDQPDIPVPQCQFGTPITGTGTALDGINEVNNMPLWEVEDAALVALNKWMTQGVQPAHSPQITTVRALFVFDIPVLDKYGNAEGGIRLPEIAVPTEFYSPINFSKFDPGSLTISAAGLQTLVYNTLNTLFVTGSINDTASRSEGLCLLSGFWTALSDATIAKLYPSHASYVAKYTAAANAAVTAGFLTPADRDDAVAAAQASAIP